MNYQVHNTRYKDDIVAIKIVELESLKSKKLE